VAGVHEIPQIRVYCDSRPLEPAASRAISSVLVQQRLSLPALCEIVFTSPEAAVELRIGTSIEVSLGTPGCRLFEGEVTAVSYEQGGEQQVLVRVRAYDRLQQLRKRQSVRDFVSMSTREVVAKIAGDYGLSVKLAATGPLWHQLVQYRQSDFELLQEVAAKSGLYFFLHRGALQFTTLEGDNSNVPLELGTSLLQVRFEANSDPFCSAVEVNGWDPWIAATTRGKADRPRASRGAKAQADDRQDAGATRRVFGVALQSGEQAQAGAQAELDRRTASGLTVWGIADGNPGLYPGCGVEVRGVSGEFAGAYVLSAVTHTIDTRGGYLTEFDSALPVAKLAPKPADVTLGEVIRVDDPRRLGRVKLRLSCYQDIETGWLEVLLPGAGRDKGLIAIPAAGDQVLVLLVGGDPAQGIVLGGLFGTSAPADLGVEKNAVRRFLLRTPGGQQLCLEDGNDSVRLLHSSGARIELEPERTHISDSSGSYLTLTKGESVLHSATDLKIEAPGKSIRIAADAIDFERT